MKLLIFDTAHRRGYAAIGEDKAALTIEDFEADTIASVVEELLKKMGWKITDLDRVGVGIGPGSFTGLRVGAAFAKGLNLATGVPLVGYCSLAAYGKNSCFDARAGGVYFYDGKEPRVCPVQELEGMSLTSVDAEVLCSRGLQVDKAKIQFDALFCLIAEGEALSDGALSLLYLKGVDRYTP